MKRAAVPAVKRNFQHIRQEEPTPASSSQDRSPDPETRFHRAIIYDRRTGELIAAVRVLYVIFVLCVAALLFTALAAARHIRRHETARKAAIDELPASSEVDVLAPVGKAPGD
jgi:hypothetical protein